MPPPEDNKANRMAELAVELLGAKMTAEFVREAWVVASPEAKAAMADALVAHVIAEIKGGQGWHVRDVITDTARDAVRARHAEIKAAVDLALGDIGERVLSEARSALDGYVQNIAREAARDTLHEAVTRVLRAARSS